MIRISTPAETLFFFLVASVNWLFAQQTGHYFFTLLSVLLFVWLCLLTLRLAQGNIAFFTPFLVNRLSVIVALLAVESGAHLSEVERFGEPTGATAAYVFFCAVLFLSYGVAVSAFSRALPRDEVQARLFTHLGLVVAVGILALCSAILLMMLIKGLQTGFPLITGMDRFLYRRLFADTALLYALNMKFVFAALLGFVFFHMRRIPPFLKLGALCLFIALSVTYFLFGDKFFTIISNTLVFLTPVLLQRWKEIPRLLLRWSPAIALFFGVLLSLTYYIYSDYGKKPPDVVFTAMGERMAAQGQLWHLAHGEEGVLLRWNEPLIDRHLALLSEPEPQLTAMREGVGTHYFIQRYAPAWLKDSIYRNAGSVTFTMGYEAQALVMFGYVGLVLALIVTGVIIAIPAAYAAYSYRNGSPIGVLFSTYILLMVIAATNQGTPWVFIGAPMWKWYLVIAVFEMGMVCLAFAQSRRRRRNAGAVAAPRPLAPSGSRPQASPGGIGP